MKMHLSRPNLIIGKSSAICGQRAKQKLRTTNVEKMENCKKCRKVRKSKQGGRP